MTQAQIIDAVLQAPPERLDAILQAAKGRTTSKPKSGTIREAAEILKCSRRTVARYAESGLLHSIRISPRCIRYDLDEVEMLATQGAVVR